MAQNGIRLLFNTDKTADEQDAAFMTIQAAISDLCDQYDIFQLEVNYTHAWQSQPHIQAEDQQ